MPTLETITGRMPARRLLAAATAVALSVSRRSPIPNRRRGSWWWCFDAVPFESALTLARSESGEPLLDSLQGPVPLVSSFPSNTSVALTAILARFGLESPPGYENKFFDLDAGKVRGGSLGSYGKIRFDWHHFLRLAAAGLLQ